MKSPFPGMDPFIEARGLWADFHQHLIAEIKGALCASTPEHYLVRTAARSYVVTDPASLGDTGALADEPVLISPGPERGSGQGGDSEGAAVTMRAFLADHHRETFVNVYTCEPEQRLVTSIEVLSPSNKRRGTEGWDRYQRQRQAHLLGAAHLVEIDLLRGGSKLPMLDPWPDAPYTLLVCRQRRAPYCQVWPAHFRKPLPPVPVPLADPDPDVPLALQPMIEAVYARARYHRSIDYARPLSPGLSAEEQGWLAEQLRTRQTPA